MAKVLANKLARSSSQSTADKERGGRENALLNGEWGQRRKLVQEEMDGNQERQKMGG